MSDSAEAQYSVWFTRWLPVFAQIGALIWFASSVNVRIEGLTETVKQLQQSEREASKATLDIEKRFSAIEQRVHMLENPPYRRSK